MSKKTEDIALTIHPLMAEYAQKIANLIVEGLVKHNALEDNEDVNLAEEKETEEENEPTASSIILTAMRSMPTGTLFMREDVLTLARKLNTKVINKLKNSASLVNSMIHVLIKEGVVEIARASHGGGRGSRSIYRRAA